MKDETTEAYASGFKLSVVPTGGAKIKILT